MKILSNLVAVKNHFSASNLLNSGIYLDDFNAIEINQISALTGLNSTQVKDKMYNFILKAEETVRKNIETRINERYDNILNSGVFKIGVQNLRNEITSSDSNYIYGIYFNLEDYPSLRGVIQNIRFRPAVSGSYDFYILNLKTQDILWMDSSSCTQDVEQIIGQDIIFRDLDNTANIAFMFNTNGNDVYKTPIQKIPFNGCPTCPSMSYYRCYMEARPFKIMSGIPVIPNNFIYNGNTYGLSFDIFVEGDVEFIIQENKRLFIQSLGLKSAQTLCEDILSSTQFDQIISDKKEMYQLLAKKYADDYDLEFNNAIKRLPVNNPIGFNHSPRVRTVNVIP